MAYTIKIEFKTGSSLEDHIEKTCLEMTWKEEENALKNLERIKEHHGWYMDHEKSWGKKQLKEPEWHEGCEPNTIILEADNGNPMHMSAFWHGWFERLISAEVIVDKTKHKINF